jgi:hydrogenase maturation protease
MSPGAGSGTLVLGYGNPGRLDDGLGPAVARAVAELRLPDVTVEEAYQLTVEDAVEVARHERVVFVDAAVEGPEPFALLPVEPRPWDGGAFATHTVAPSVVLGLARDVYGARTRGWLLAVRGYRFRAFGEGLSPGARANLAAAVGALRGWVGPRLLGPVPRARAVSPPGGRPGRHPSG